MEEEKREIAPEESKPRDLSDTAAQAPEGEAAAAAPETGPAAPAADKAAVRKRNRLIGGIAAAVVLCAALAIAAAALLYNPTKLLAQSWKNTATVLEARGGAQPLGVIAEALRNGKGGRQFVLSGDMNGDGGTLTVTVGGDHSLAASANVNYQGESTDLTAYYGTDFAGLASRALFGSDAAYGAQPGTFAEQAKGSIFDPVTGKYPLNADTLRELDDLLTADSGEDKSAGEGSLRETGKQLAKELRGFLRSVKGKRGSGAVPEVGGKAKILTYVYPADRTIELLQSMSDTLFASSGFQAYLGDLGKFDKSSPDAQALQEKCNKAIDSLRQNYTGDVTVTYYIKDKKVVYLRVGADPTYKNETVHGLLSIDFGMSSGVLKAAVNVSDADNTAEAALSSEQTFQDGVAEDKWELTVRDNDKETCRVTGSSVWNSESGDYQASFAAHDGEKTMTLSAQGTLKVGKADFGLTLDKVAETDWAGGTRTFSAALQYKSGVEVPKPSEEKNFFALTSDEFVSLAASAAGKAAPLYGALTGSSAAPDLTGSLDGSGGGTGAAESETTADEMESVKASPIDGYTYMGKAQCGDQEVFFPVGDGGQAYEGMLTIYAGGVSFSVYTYDDMGDVAQAIDSLTGYWKDMDSQKDYSDVVLGGTAAAGTKAARAASYSVSTNDKDTVRMATAYFVEVRGTTAVVTEINVVPDWAAATDGALLAEYDKLAQMPLKAASLLS